jgi:hypothetical protein
MHEPAFGFCRESDVSRPNLHNNSLLRNEHFNTIITVDVTFDKITEDGKLNTFRRKDDFMGKDRQLVSTLAKYLKYKLVMSLMLSVSFMCYILCALPCADTILSGWTC